VPYKVSGVNWSLVRPWIGTVARLLLGVVWIWASLSKLSDPLKFTQAVRAYDATPEWLSKAIGYGLPVLELCLAIVLILGLTVRIAAAVSAALFFVFLIGLIQAAARGLQLTCGCFGGGGPTDHSTGYTLDILRDIGLLIVAVFLVLWPMTRLSIEEYLARHDHVEVPSAKRMRSPEGRRRYEAQVAAKQKEARSRNMYLNTAIVVIVALVSVIGIGVQSGRAKINGVVVGVNANASDGVVFGKKAAATVDLYEDFGCPICKEFENQVSHKLDAQVRANLAQVRFHPISILDGNFTTPYSTMAGNAALCVSDVSVDDFVAFHNLLYGSFQPAEGTAGPGNTELIALARRAVPKSKIAQVSNCITSQQYVPLLKKLTDNASKAGIHATPTVLVNGRSVSHTASALFGAIKQANVGHKPSPSPTPSASTSSSAAPSPSPSSSSKK
jgi:protein-disulfide isomerase